MIENRLWSIPMSEVAFADRVEEVIDSDDISKLYRLYERYIDKVKADSRKSR